MARRKPHEEHVNHEAWAIPYGDLVTLLLAFFVVMYAISTVNEGKYRAVSDSLSAAFAGSTGTLDPTQVGSDRAVAPGAATALDAQGNVIGTQSSLLVSPQGNGVDENGLSPMDRVVAEVEQNMAELIESDKLAVRRKEYGVEIELRTDILFPSGSATLAPQAEVIMQRLADTFKALPNALRVEGHTDNRPINTAEFPSNWELSAARAATVVRVFMQRGIDPTRMIVMGQGEFRPAASNDTDEGRNANRRVLVVIENDNTQQRIDPQSPRPATQTAQSPQPLQPTPNTPATASPSTTG
jgi:chemotaxis protein MotB